MNVTIGFDEVIDARTGDAVRTPVLRVLSELRAERAHELQDEIRAFVDAGLNPLEREGMSALLQRLTLARTYGAGDGTPAQQWAMFALLGALSWAESALALGAVVAEQCAACTTYEELQAVVVDVAVLGPPPSVTAGEIARALQGG